MKIDKSVQPLSPGHASSQPRNVDQGSSKGYVGQTVSAIASSNIVQIGEAAAKVSESSASFNAERVAEIKKAISEGRFKVDAEKIADGLLTSVREMLNKSKQTA